MEDIIDIIVTETTNLIEITSQPTDEVIDVNIIDNREDITLNVTPTVVEININSLTGNFGVTWGEITGTLSSQTDLQTVLNAKADLVGGKVPSSQLPSYVDDVVEVATYSALPVTGETGKIYVVLDTNLIYRWSGSAYIEIKDSSAVWGAITGTLSNQTDLQNALDAKFDDPTGDTTQYIAGDGSLITFPVAGQAGTLVREVRNITGATLTKGTIVYISGATGNKPTVSKAIATGDSTSAQTFGMCQADISNNSNGYVVCVGDLSGLDTSGLSEGAQLYLSSTTAGTYTTTKQLAPAHLVYIGIVTRAHPTQGQIEVKIQNGYELDEIHDVAISSKSNNDGLFYEASTDLWKNKSIATVLGYTPQAQLNGTGFVKISGTTISYDNSTYALDSAVVKLTGNQTIAGTKTFTSSLYGTSGVFSGQLSATSANINGDNTTNALYITHNSSFNSLVIIQSGAGAAIYADGKVFANQFIKIGGSSSQFLKADGSVDSSTYLTTGTAASTYLPLSGGTLTGALSGTSISLSSSVTASALYVTGMTAGSGAIYHTASRLTFANYNASGTLHFEVNGGSSALTLNADTSASFVAGASFGGALSGTSATFSSNLQLTGDGYVYGNATTGSGTIRAGIRFNSTSQELKFFTADAGRLTIDSSGAATFEKSVSVGTGLRLSSNTTEGEIVGTSGRGLKFYTNDGITNALTLATSGAATFSSSVTIVGNGRNVTINGGVDIKGDAGGWATQHGFSGSTGTDLGGFGANGSGNTISSYYIGTQGSPKIFVNASYGNVGIGTTSPANYTNYITQTINGTNGAIVQLQSSGTPSLRLIGEGVDSYIDNVSTGALIFRTTSSSSERMRITSGGNLLIGTTSDNSLGKLQVNGSVNSFAGSLSSVNGSAQYLFTFDNSRPRMGFLTAQTTNGSGAYYYTGIISNRGGSNTADTLFGNAIAITFSGNNVYITTTNSANINTWTWSFLYID